MWTSAYNNYENMCLNTKIRNHHSRRAHGDRAGFLSQQTDGPHGKRSGQDCHGHKAESLTRLLENSYLSDIVECRKGGRSRTPFCASATPSGRSSSSSEITSARGTMRQALRRSASGTFCWMRTALTCKIRIYRQSFNMRREPVLCVSASPDG